MDQETNEITFSTYTEKPWPTVIIINSWKILWNGISAREFLGSMWISLAKVIGLWHDMAIPGHLIQVVNEIPMGLNVCSLFQSHCLMWSSDCLIPWTYSFAYLSHLRRLSSHFSGSKEYLIRDAKHDVICHLADKRKKFQEELDPFCL